jgi:mono/diheme cytochrome c family protein
MKSLFILFVALMAAAVMYRVWAQGGGGGELARGRELYGHRCKICHGADGKGNGPAGEYLSPRPANFTAADFWKGDVDKKIENTIINGHGPMPAFNMKPGEIKEITDYLSHTFKPAGK